MHSRFGHGRNVASTECVSSDFQDGRGARLPMPEGDVVGGTFFSADEANGDIGRLVEHRRGARLGSAEMRGGGQKRVEFTDDLAISPERLDEVLVVDEVLRKLAEKNVRQARVVELRYFGGLSVEQIGDLLGVAPRSVKRDWSLARIWLLHQLRPDLGDSPASD